jgi:hypothetical protein
MRSFSRAVFVVGVALLLVVPAMAQQRQRGQGQGRGGRGGGFGGPGLAGLIRNEGVQKELGLTSDQTQKAEEAVQKVSEKYQDERATLRDLSPEERREKMTALNTKINDESLKALHDVLKPEQLKRLKQVELQQRGPDALTDPEIQSKLNLTSDQKSKIKTIAADYAAERGQLFQGARGGGGDFQEAQKKMTAMRKATMEKISDVLTSAQKETWKEMTGTPFEVQFQGRGRRGGQ